MVFALSGGHKLGMLLVAAAFIAFAVASAFLIPRYRPDFPGRGLRVYIGATVVLFVAMMLAVEFFARESEPAAAEKAKPAEAAPATTQAAAPAGDPARGKAVFASSGCGGCHTFAAAGSSGNVGPNLDTQLPADAGKAGQPLAAFARQSIVDPNAYVAPGLPKGVMPGSFGTTLSKEQIDDLVAFLTQKTAS